LGHGDGTLDAFLSFPFTTSGWDRNFSSQSLSVGDFNHDDWPDLAITTKTGINVLYGVARDIVTLPTPTPAPSTPRDARTYYVKPAESGTGKCDSWSNACTLQAALTDALSHDEIWVAAGTYKPTSGTDRKATFQLKNGVDVYGGFSGSETAREQRDPAANLTILSGDLNGDDSGFTNNTENAYHVVTGANNTVLDGFTITAGNAPWVDYMVGGGGGMYNFYSSPTLTNIIITGNSAVSYGGGGMFNRSSKPVLTNVIFSNNQAGGLYNEYSNPILKNVTFSGNKSEFGGGIYNAYNSNPTLTDVIISGNSATYFGGGMYNEYSSPVLTNVTFKGNSANYGGGICNDISNPILTNVTISGNTAAYGGGLSNNWEGDPVLTNVTISGNSATTYGGGIYNDGSSKPLLRNTIIWGNSNPSGAQFYFNNGTSDIYNSVMQGGCPNFGSCTNVISSDPRLGTLGSYGGFTQTIPLLAGSSAIDTGNDSTCATTDQRGVKRPQNAHCDIGAFESDAPVVTLTATVTNTPTTTRTMTVTPTMTVTRTLTLTRTVTPTITVTKTVTPLIATRTMTPTATNTWTITSTATRSSIPISTYFVKPTASGTGYCDSWANACQLQSALTRAVKGNEIWVAVGMYKPTTDADRYATFQLKDGVAIYGGFSGVEDARDQRDPASNPTILSGDLNGDDQGFTNNAENVYHVVTGVSGASLDGFIITAGNANGTVCPGSGCGGGIYNYSSSPTFTNVTISGNSSANYGGGMYNTSGSNPSLSNDTFNSNSAAYNGGGMYNNSSSPTLKNVIFNKNWAGLGGGLSNDSSYPVLIDVTFSANSGNSGAGMFNEGSSPALLKITFSDNSAVNSGGGLYNSYGSNAALTNVTFSGNSAQYGGGMYNSINSKPILTNVTFSVNSTTISGGGIYNDASSPQIRNTILWGNTAPSGAQVYNSSSTSVLSDSVVQGGCPASSTCAKIITADPRLGALSSYGSFTETIPLLAGSPAIDTGNDNICAATDQRGMMRPQGTHCDIGAYEYDDSPIATVTAIVTKTATATVTMTATATLTPASTITLTPTMSPLEIYYVKAAVSGVGNCQNWENACALQTALNGAASGKEIWVAAGTYKPTTGTLRTATFQLKSSVAVYGGFNGTEITRAQRNPSANLTILSGDLNGDDQGFTNNIENVYHVVTGATGATLDGFTIMAGNANGEGTCPGAGCGGGMSNSASSSTLINITFKNNFAAYGGGGLSNADGSNAILTNIKFSGNSSDDLGGGMASFSSNPILTNVTFIANSASSFGGGLYNSSGNPSLINVTFDGNTASEYGGGMENNGGGSPALTNVTFSGNLAGGYGGGLYNSYNCSPSLTNVTFSGNSANHGGGMYNYYNVSSPQTNNAIFWGNTASSAAQIYNSGSSLFLSDSLVQDGCPANSTCTKIVTADPLLGTLSSNGGFTQTIPLLAGSAAIDTGNDTTCAATDQRGVIRPQGAHCDIGAYEYVFPVTTLTPTSTETATITVTRTITVSNTPTVTVALTATVTQTKTPEPSLTPSVTATQTSTAKVTQTKTPEPSLTPSVTATQTFTPAPPAPLAPALVAPANALATNDTTPTFNWSAVTNGNTYQLEISNTTNFASKTQTFTGAPGILSYTATALPAGIFYWHARALNINNLAGAWSEVRSFSVDLTPPAAPVLSNPANAALVIGTPAFTWLASTGAAKYQFQYDNNANFASPTYTSVELIALTITPPTIAPGAYSWHVRAKDAAGNWSAWSVSRTVTIQPAVPLAPALTAPVNALVTNDTTPAFSWSAVAYGNTYQLEISNTASFTVKLRSFTGAAGVLTYTTTTLPAGTYYWHARAVNVKNSAGPWSAVRTFSIDLTPPAAPVLSTPANAAQVSGTPAFAWLAAATATKYQFQYDENIDFSSPTYTSVELAELNFTPPGMAAGIYAWRARARDAAGNWSAWSAARTILITLTPTATSTPNPGTPTVTPTPTKTPFGCTDC
jgi:predicted outer membrane repeat protein